MATGNLALAADHPLRIEEAYDLSAAYYDEWKWQRFWRRMEAPIVFEALIRFRRTRSADLDLLDVGCGTGWYLSQLDGLCAETSGVDLSAGMLAIARRRLPRTTLLQRDARSLTFSFGRFDAILCTRVLSHVPHVSEAIAEMSRLLMPGGVLILSDVDASHDYDQTRLPVARSHVAAPTYKHLREHVFETVEAAGFVQDSASLIFEDETVRQIKRRPDAGTSRPAAGWVGSWRRVPIAGA